MKPNIEKIVSKWLKKLAIPTSKSFIKKQLRSHPEYPSLVSITDTLDELGIDNASLVVDKERIGEIPTPFLAHITNDGGNLLLVTDIQDTKKQVPDFLNAWDGIVLVAEKPLELLHTENAKELAKEKKQRELQLFAIVSIILLSFGSLVTDFSWTAFALLATTMAGCFVGVLLVQHELGIDNAVTDQLCQTGKNTDCDAVLHSKKSKIFTWLNLPDVVLIWFSSLLLFLTVSFYTGIVIASLEMIALLSACALPVTLASIYYQWRVVKKWCTLCLLTIALLWMQTALMVPELLNIQSWQINNSPIFLLLFVVFLIASAWLVLVKPLYKEEQTSAGTVLKLLRFKNNLKIFMSLLKEQREIEVTAFEEDLQLANEHARIQVMVCCSLYCNPCTTAHGILHKLAEKYDFGLTVRFYVTANAEDQRRKAIKYILQLLNKKSVVYKRNVLHDWYKIMDFEKFKEKYPLAEETDIEKQLKLHAEWSKNNDIKFTPTIIINGHLLPKSYDVEDLRNMMPGLIENVANGEVLRKPI